MLVNQKLTNLQLEMIKMFSYQLNEIQLIEIRDILTSCFAEKATNEMDKLWETRRWTNETMDKWANEHLRTSQKG